MGHGREQRLVAGKPRGWRPGGGGLQIAVAAGQKCRRFGIYIVASESRRSRRASNVCRPARRRYQQDRLRP